MPKSKVYNYDRITNIKKLDEKGSVISDDIILEKDIFDMYTGEITQVEKTKVDTERLLDHKNRLQQDTLAIDDILSKISSKTFDQPKQTEGVIKE